MLIGSHVHFGSEQILGSTKEAISYGANTFMFYTGAPQNTIRSSIKEEYISKSIDLMKENGIDINKVICHAPYIINLANNKKEDSLHTGYQTQYSVLSALSVTINSNNLET